MDHLTPSPTIDKETGARRHVGERSNRRSRSRPRRITTRSRIRVLYFGLAALWGYTIGAAAFAAALKAIGHPVSVDPMLIGIAVLGALLALLGGVIAAAAYREARRRRSA